ncbi:hypothetical protein F2S72_01515 [Pseudomonas syringae pv. actinidiae]|nr:hypothetical protein [Pseudomonas syringae pv. actinidiae]
MQSETTCPQTLRELHVNTSSTSKISRGSGTESRQRVIVAVTAFASIFGVSAVALSAALPMPLSMYLKHILLLAVYVFASGANAYSAQFDVDWRDKLVWLSMVGMFVTTYVAAQACVNEALQAPESYLSGYTAVAAALMLTVAGASSFVVSKVFLDNFSLLGLTESPEHDLR